MELQLLAQIANEIFGTGQVFSAGRNLTPPNGTTGREERVWLSQTCWCFTAACMCVLLYHHACKDLLLGSIKTNWTAA